ncbi:hypothetical protein [Stigmatella aurantiaca]|uniref:Lipoprotein n=2 Tax=Stigmatella aurantiaca (strain DW4/3-1) TaxID=378806 RepID=E3FVA9_STIAD|nr:hypothetical protein [Stigmatella aurantiaca]ADO70935.1 uncharacterized protein STAUR_3143 [Stigmatella aurantiaca DW4/3-1]
MRRIAWVVLWGVMLGTMGGCSLRKVSRSAASGAIESLGEPGEEEVFRRKVARVADRFLDNALKDPPDAREIGRDTASGMLEGVEGYLSEEGRGARLGEAGAGFAQELVPVLAAEMRNMAPTSRLILEQSGQGLVDGLSSRREEIAALMAEIADQVGRSMASAMAQQLRHEMQQQAAAPPNEALSQAVEGVAYRAAAAGMRGAMNELGQTVPECKDGPCAPQVVSQLSRSALGGAVAALMPVVLVGFIAFVVGVGVAALAARALVRRQTARRV